MPTKIKDAGVHPYIPNSVPAVQREMLREIGVRDLEALYADIPAALRFRGKMKLPPACRSEQELKQHVERILAQNQTCAERLSFLGGGCANHYVPAICDEIVQRAEFLTAYAGEPYEDAGRFQALFEYESLMGELLDFDVVNVPTYDWGQAASTALRMAARITGRTRILVSDTLSPDRYSIIRNYCAPMLAFESIRHDPGTGLLEVNDLRAKMDDTVAAIYFENPSYLGFIETQGEAIAGIAHRHGGLCVVGTDPLALGVLKPPSQYGADLACGCIQGLGNHMYFGGSVAGFIASRDEPKFVLEYPSRLFGIARTSVEDEWGFGDVTYGRTSFDKREKGKEFIGTAAALYGIAAAVYLSLLGPRGLRELGQHLLQKNLYARKTLARVRGLSLRFSAMSFKEFVIDFSRTGLSVRRINQALRKHGIFGGHDLSAEFPALKNCALYCFTEAVSQADIDRLAQTLKTILP